MNAPSQPQVLQKPPTSALPPSTRELPQSARFINVAPRIQGFNGSGPGSITFMPSEEDVEVELTGEQVAVLLADPCAKALVECGDLIDVDNVFGLAKRRRARQSSQQQRKIPAASSTPQL